jgi:hypothetical protein
MKNERDARLDSPDAIDGIDRRDFALMGCAMAGGLLAFSEAAQADQTAGQVRDVVGTAMAELRARQRPLASGAPVFVGDTVSTGAISRVSLLIGGVTTLRLGAGARLTIDRFLLNAGGTMTLSAGAMLFSRPEDAPKQNVKIRGAFGMIAVRGTEFFVGPSRGKQAIFVRRGRVLVASGRRTVQLGMGEGTDVAAPGAPPSAPRVWPGDRVAEAYASVR